MSIAPISFRPTAADMMILDKIRALDDSMTPTGILQRGLRLVYRERWQEQAMLDAIRLKDEDLSNEPDDWSFAEDGSIITHIGGKI